MASLPSRSASSHGFLHKYKELHCSRHGTSIINSNSQKPIRNKNPRTNCITHIFHQASPDHFNMHSSTTFSLLSILPFLPTILSAPAALYPRDNASSNCSPYDPTTRGPYAVQNDIWGATPSGDQKQCSSISSFDGSSLAWSTTFTWTGDGNAVKTYANAENKEATPCKPLNQYTSMKTSWTWEYVFFFFRSHLLPPRSPTFSRTGR